MHIYGTWNRLELWADVGYPSSDFAAGAKIFTWNGEGIEWLCIQHNVTFLDLFHIIFHIWSCDNRVWYSSSSLAQYVHRIPCSQITMVIWQCPVIKEHFSVSHNPNGLKSSQNSMFLDYLCMSCDNKRCLRSSFLTCTSYIIVGYTV